MSTAKRAPAKKIWTSLRHFVFFLLCIGTGAAHAGDAEINSSAAALHSKYAASLYRLGHNQFQRPLYLDSSETSDGVAGDVYALLDYPLAIAGAALGSPDNWCDILLLHLNTKYCRASIAGRERVLNLSIGKKHDQPLDDAYQVIAGYQVVAQSPNYLQVRLDVDKGPLSTRDYRIVIEAIAPENGKTFIHISYSYKYGLVGRLAMQAYLATIGRDKVGFTVVGTQADRQPLYIGGMRGVVERNTMRYYLAIEAFLGALSTPRQEQPEKRFRDWFSAIERYPRQLHELERSEYLDMKRKEFLRQHAGHV